MFSQQGSGPVVGRFAPSPTGLLHFGSLVAAVGSYCLARRAGGRWLVRIEDLDTPRVVPGADEWILRTLEGFGMFWDGEVLWQSRRLQRYEAALERLREKDLLFACGSQEQCLVSAVGDFVLRRADGLFAYQLAVVVDDAESGVNQVVRGQDLLFSTPRQVFLHACLGYRVPDYVHLPLVLAADGEKVSKRHGALAVEVGGERGELLWRALRFLGQPVPDSFRAAPPGEVLAWGTAHFDLERVPDRPAGIAG
jgi:glutamyl-Q tRNA(Asp) synthetase